MADFEDSNSPTWENVIEGQANLCDAVNGTITYDSPEGKHYELRQERATLMVRPRGWHLVEKHFLVEGEPISASLFDFGLFFFHNAKALLGNGSGPYFYLPKMESRHEARLWNDVFIKAQEELGLARGSIRATVLIETILASFEMEEILWELREHSAGLNCGRWDYIFSFIKKFRNRAGWGAAGPGAGDHAEPLPGVLRGPADRGMPPPRGARHGRHGGADPHQERSGGQCGGRWPACATTSCARFAPGTTARGWRIRGWWRWPSRCSTRICRSRTSSAAPKRRP